MFQVTGIIFLLSVSVSIVAGLTPGEQTALRDLARENPALQRATPPWNATDATRACSSPPWAGVKCDPSRAVVGLSLIGWSLTGTIPTSLGNLESLQQLEIFDTHMTGTVPASLASLHNLVHLAIQKNAYLEKMPDVFDELTQLETVLLDHAPIPTSIGNCTKLTLMDIQSDGNFSLPCWNSLVALTDLTLTGDRFEGSLDGALCVPSLRMLEISSIKSYKLISPSLAPLTGLKYVTLAGFSDEIPSTLFSAPQIQTFSATRWRNFDSLPEFPEGCPLTELEIDGVGTTSLGRQGLPDSIGRLNFLKKLHVKYFLRGTIPASINNLTALTTLDLSNNYFGGAFPEIGRLVNLEQLSLGGNNFSGVLPRSFSSLPRLRTLDLYGSSFTGCFHENSGMSSCYLPASGICVCDSRLCRSNCTGGAEISCCVPRTTPTLAPSAPSSPSGGIIAISIIGVVIVFALPIGIILYNRSRKTTRVQEYEILPMNQTD